MEDVKRIWRFRLRGFRGLPFRWSVQEAHISRVQSAHIGRVHRARIGGVKGPAKKGEGEGVPHQKIKGSHIRSWGPTSGRQGGPHQVMGGPHKVKWTHQVMGASIRWRNPHQEVKLAHISSRGPHQDV